MRLFSCSATNWLKTNLLGTEPQTKTNKVELALYYTYGTEPECDPKQHLCLIDIIYIMGNALEIYENHIQYDSTLLCALIFTYTFGNSWHFIALQLTQEF